MGALWRGTLKTTRTIKQRLWSDTGLLVLFALGWLVFLTGVDLLATQQYGFHRDELAALDNGQHLAWGYVEYPPFTPLVARLATILFGTSVIGVRLFPALAVCASLVAAGLMARTLGGSRWAQLLTAFTVAIASITLFNGFFFSYQTFDYLFWLLALYGLLRILQSEDQRWWLWVGASLGLGLMNKYTVVFLAVGIAAAVLLTPARRSLKSPWLWAGVGLAVLICLPNLVWQAQHALISLAYQEATHARNVQQGRTGDYLLGQLYVCVNPASLGLVFAGLRFTGWQAEGRRYRALAWLFGILFLVFLLINGRHYYLAPAYPMLIAAGLVWNEQRQAGLTPAERKARRRGLYETLATGTIILMIIVLPLAPIHSDWWNLAINLNSELREEVGWHELTGTVADIYQGLPAGERSSAGILTGNYGEAAAINLYGPAYGLPEAISGIDSYWLRGYGDPPPQTLIVVGFPGDAQQRQAFDSCTLAGHNDNRFGILNEESRDHPDIFVCRGLRLSWPELWGRLKSFG
jgi:4-amino-4-deoxy-L-arabinose transferase-like glycosyltransferase